MAHFLLWGQPLLCVSPSSLWLVGRECRSLGPLRRASLLGDQMIFQCVSEPEKCPDTALFGRAGAELVRSRRELGLVGELRQSCVY